MSFQITEPRADKAEEVAEVKEMLSSNSTAILASYDKLTVKDASNLRKKLREADAQFRVVKNTLFKLAAQGTPVESLTEKLAGPTAVAVTASDPVAVAKALVDFARDSKGLISIKSGCVDGAVMSAADVQVLSTIPPRPMLLAQVVGGLQAPISGLVFSLQYQITSLVMTLQAVSEKQAA